MRPGEGKEGFIWGLRGIVLVYIRSWYSLIIITVFASIAHKVVHSGNTTKGVGSNPRDCT